MIISQKKKKKIPSCASRNNNNNNSNICGQNGLFTVSFEKIICKFEQCRHIQTQGKINKINVWRRGVVQGRSPVKTLFRFIFSRNI